MKPRLLIEKPEVSTYRPPQKKVAGIVFLPWRWRLVLAFSYFGFFVSIVLLLFLHHSG